MRTRFIAICCMIVLSTGSLAADSLVGKTVSDVTRLVGVDLASGSIIDEPPAVVRGIEFRTWEGVELQVFIARGQVPLTFAGRNDLTRYKNLKVTGIRRIENLKVYCEGDVLWHYPC